MNPAKSVITMVLMVFLCVSFVVFGDDAQARERARRLQVARRRTLAGSGPSVTSKLETRVPMINFQDAPVEEVLQFFRDYARVNLIIKQQEIERSRGPIEDITVTLTLRDISVEDALEHVMDLTGLQYEIKHRALVVGVEASREPVIRFYDVLDLCYELRDFSAGGGGGGRTSGNNEGNRGTSEGRSSGGSSSRSSRTSRYQVLNSGLSSSDAVTSSGGSSSTAQAAQRLVQLIKAVISPESWSDETEQGTGGDRLEA